jgi:hypothetical protein
VKAGLDRIRLVHSPIDDAARQRADDDVGQHLGDHLAIGIAAGALVPQGVVVPLRSLVAGVPGSV